MLGAERRVHINYLQTKVDNEDWHGVADAANDLREIDQRIEALRDVIGTQSIR